MNIFRDALFGCFVLKRRFIPFKETNEFCTLFISCLGKEQRLIGKQFMRQDTQFLLRFVDCSFDSVCQDILQFSLHRFLIHFNCFFTLKMNRIIDQCSRVQFKRLPQHIRYSFKKYAQFVHSLGIQLPLFSMI